jgi:hypothetical protein
MSATPTIMPGTHRPRIEHRPDALWPLLAIMAFLSVGGFVGGIPMLQDPTGGLIGAQTTWLEETPVDDFLLPGIFLTAVYGVGVLVLMAGLATRASPGPLRSLDRATGRHWAWWGTIGVGAVLEMWIVYEYLVLPLTSGLMPTLLIVGALMVALPLLPSMAALLGNHRS